MSNPLAVGLIVFALILGGAYAGWKLRKLLPTQHLTEETKNLASVSTAIVATLSALVLGLLISNANSSFIRLGGEVTALSDKFSDWIKCCSDTVPSPSRLGKSCASMPPRKRPTCSQTIPQVCA